MLNNNYIAALDIGSNKIAGVVARIKKGRISELFFEVHPSKGIKHGLIVDSIELSSALSAIIKKLRMKSGIGIKYIAANISGEDIITKHSRAIIPLAERGNKVITASDVQRANEQASVLGSSLEEEIIHQIPHSYAIDSKAGVFNPLGLYSHRLEVDLFLICAKQAAVQSLARAINQSGCELKSISLSTVATVCASFNKKTRQETNIFCDIGSDIIEILVFKRGLLKDLVILRAGGSTLTEALAETLKIPVDLAEEVKKSYTSIGDTEGIDPDKEILIKTQNMYKPIKQKLASQIVTAQAEIICAKIKSAVETHMPFDEINNFMVAGRSVLLEGFLEMLESKLGFSVKFAKPGHQALLPFINNEDALAGQRYLTYLTALGLVCEELQAKENRHILPFNQPIRNPFSRVINRAKEVYQEYF